MENFCHPSLGLGLQEAWQGGRSIHRSYRCLSAEVVNKMDCVNLGLRTLDTEIDMRPTAPGRESLTGNREAGNQGPGGLVGSPWLSAEN